MESDRAVRTRKPKAKRRARKKINAHALIALDNERLLGELRQRTLELGDLLEQQKATSEVLHIISNSPGELPPVFEAILQNATRICEAKFGTLYLNEASKLRLVATHDVPPAFAEARERAPIDPAPDSPLAVAVKTKRLVHIADLAATRSYAERHPGVVHSVEIGGIRSVIAVPLLKDDTLIGVLTIYRQEVRSFTEKQITLLMSFAAQAIIAVENARLFDEIQDKSRQLEIASKHKSQFLANMSHELRTPHNAILGYTELILDNIYGEAPQKMRAVLERVQTNGKHLLDLINDVLDLSKIEAGQFVLSLADYSVADMVQSVYTAVEPLASSKKLGLTVDLPRDLPPAYGDDRRLKQVLLNLVGNAIKFTDSGNVTIDGSAADGSYTIAVRDTGPGIAEVDQTKIFEEFRQGDNARAKSKGGTGLGLAISKRIVEMHGGRLWVNSRPGDGSTFSFTVPLRATGEAGRS